MALGLLRIRLLTNRLPEQSSCDEHQRGARLSPGRCGQTVAAFFILSGWKVDSTAARRGDWGMQLNQLTQTQDATSYIYTKHV